ncbi:nascent polypeptide-associated complex protein [Candidatus Woesearchaeota archaeon]|nr:nascent polypeptide-associated complex protein [Candidatus Woesearchaeota archaeon]
MMPKINPRMMQQAMKQMGIKQEELDAVEVVIRLHDKDIVITNPHVAKVNMMGQESFQISGTIKEQPRTLHTEINEDDVKTVMEQAGVDAKTARDALKASKGDIAEAILALKEE